MELKGSKTEKNLLAAFAGESQARNKYTYYASKAKKEGFNQIAEIFEETANNEKEHAKIWFKLLHDGIPDTIENLKDAAAGENYEWTDMYATFAKEANLEGMISETKTDDITTVAELYDYMEKQGFQFKFYDGYDRDEVDRTIKDIQAANRRLILESTGLQPLLEDMAKQRMQSQEEQHTQKMVNEEGHTLEDLMNFNPEDGDIDTEEDSSATDLNFSEEEK